MPRETIRTTTVYPRYGYQRRRRFQTTTLAIERARGLLRRSTRTTLRVPFRTGGWYGQWDRRGREELKTIDSGTSTFGATPTTGAVQLINGVATGTDYTARIGRKITMKSVLIRFTITPNVLQSPGIGDTIRLILLYDTQTNGADPGVSDILAQPNWLAPMNLNNRDRFKIIKDRFVSCEACTYTATTLTAGSPMQHNIKWYCKMTYDTIFGGTGATSGSIQTGGLFVLVISQNGSFIVNGNFRVRFKDS